YYRLLSARYHRDLASLALDDKSVVQLASLSLLHRDPVDRMLICQALESGLAIAAVDPAMCTYAVDVI
ncbi:MAG: hypothetical protein AAFW95_10885, partial [Cyanobacteria bacterium J06638_6]